MAKAQGRYNILHFRHKKYQSVVNQFYRSWNHPNKSLPQVTRVIRVTPPRHVAARYKKYKNALKMRGRFSRRPRPGMTVGNERRRWLGTVPTKCKLFRKNVEPKGRCNDKYCATCSIINSGLSMPKPRKYHFDRRVWAWNILERYIFQVCHGHDSVLLPLMYLIMINRAEDFTTMVHPARGVSALLLCKVSVGRVKRLYANNPKLKKPPRGYNSIIVEPSKRNGLTYDQLVVYNPAAVLPAYIVVYCAKQQRRSPRRILFYHTHQPYYEFTNFSPDPIMYRGKLYPTSEHLFQSLKFLDHLPQLAEHIRTCSAKPRKVFNETHKFNSEVRKDWLQIRVAMMDEVLWHKFTQHKRLQALLLSTGDSELVENSAKDSFWGVGANQRGENQLGKALMRLRAKLRSTQVSSKATVKSQ